MDKLLLLRHVSHIKISYVFEFKLFKISKWNWWIICFPDKYDDHASLTTSWWLCCSHVMISCWETRCFLSPAPAASIPVRHTHNTGTRYQYRFPNSSGPHILIDLRVALGRNMKLQDNSEQFQDEQSFYDVSLRKSMTSTMEAMLRPIFPL